MRPWLLGLIACLGLGSCSATGALAALTATPAVAASRDLAYATGPCHGLDLYRPRGSGPHPVVVFFYGGSWDSGARRDYRFVGQALAAQGYLTVIPDYRLYPEVRYPAFLQDGAMAVKWARDHAAQYGGDPGKLFLMGHSAGAYNAAMLTYDKRLLRAVGLDPAKDIMGLVGLAGPYDFLPLQSGTLKTIFGPEAQRPATQPINYVDGDEPPALFMHGWNDKVVEAPNATRMAARIKQKGGRVETVFFDRLSHPLIVASLAWPLRFLAPTMKTASSFIDREAAS